MKYMKKLVLVGLVLLASVMVLAGCKNDSVPEVKEPPYLTFKADSEQTLTMRTVNTYTLHESLQYSVGGGEWKQLQAETAISFGGTAGDLRMRGKSVGGMGIYNNLEAQFAIIGFGNSEVKVACTGDIRTLVDYESYSTADTSRACFYCLFKDCTSLTSAPDLPAETLSERCYSRMFMNCISLTSAPDLPATTLAEACYSYMFTDCTSLAEAPALPATTLAEHCYDGMFADCTSLAEVPALPATILAEACYSYMFYDCRSLVRVPDLPAETLVKRCYLGMFYGCTKLTGVTMLATDISAERALEDWLYGVAPAGTIFTAADTILPEESIPAGWIAVPQQ